MAEDIKKMPVGAGLPEMPEEIVIAPKKVAIDWKRIIFILLGLALFFLFYFMPEFADAVDPAGKHFPLPPQGRMALGLFLMAAVWWIFEVMPIGATAIAIGLFQVIFTIRTADQALKDFFDPSVWFIFGSVVMGLAFAVSGLTKRMAYKMLNIVGEKYQFHPAGHLSHHRRHDPAHGPHRGGRGHLPAAGGHPFPLQRIRPAHPVRQGPVHRHGLDRGRGFGHHLPGVGPGRGRGRHVPEVHRRHGNRLLLAHLVHAPPGGAHGVLHLAHRDHFFQTREIRASTACGTGWPAWGKNWAP